MSGKNLIFLLLGVAAAAFLIGYIPPKLELRKLRVDLEAAQLGDTAAMLYVEASQKNYGLAAQRASKFFNDIAEKPAYRDILSRRDAVTTGLAKGDPAVLMELEAILRQVGQASGLSRRE